MKNLSNQQKILVFLVILATSYLLFAIARYWYADTLYAKGSLLNDAGRYQESQAILVSAVRLSPNEAIFRDELSQAYAGIALGLDADSQKEKIPQFVEAAIDQSDKAIALSPANLNIKRNRASMFIKLSIIDPTYLKEANRVLYGMITLAPTDAKIFYNLGLTYARLSDFENAAKILEKTLELKPDYKEAKLALKLVNEEKNK